MKCGVSESEQAQTKKEPAEDSLFRPVPVYPSMMLGQFPFPPAPASAGGQGFWPF